MTDIDIDDDLHPRERQRRERQRRWATRQEAMTYAKIGSTLMNELMHSRRIFAKKRGSKVIVDLNSIDDYIDSLPDVAAASEDAAA
jgi:hypothetical protein